MTWTWWTWTWWTWTWWTCPCPPCPCPPCPCLLCPCPPCPCPPCPCPPCPCPPCPCHPCPSQPCLCHHQMISFQKIYGLSGLKHHTMEINGDVTMETNDERQTNNKGSCQKKKPVFFGRSLPNLFTH